MKRLASNPFVTTTISLGMLLIGWQLLVTLGDYEQFILPGPLAVWEAFIQSVRSGILPRHTLITLGEVLPGALIGCSLAAVLGYLLAKSTLAERIVSPYLVASQAIPIIAVAPLLTLWIPSTYWIRVTVAVLVVFFPVLVNMVTGMRSVSADLYDLMHSLHATRWQIFTKLELPAVLPILLTGLRVGMTLSVIGTLVGEFVLPRDIGLGFLLVTSRYQLKTPLVFAVLLTLGVMALSMYGAVFLLEKRLLRWQIQR